MFDNLVVTAGIHAKLESNPTFYRDVMDALRRYSSYDWGELAREDIESNNHALLYGERILAAYDTCEGRIWIITEWDRSVTTMLFPDEY